MSKGRCIIGALKNDREKNQLRKYVDGKFILCSKCLDNTPHEPAFGICQKCGTRWTKKIIKRKQ